MKLYMINTIAVRTVRNGLSDINIRASNVYEIALFGDDNEAMVASVTIGKKLLPYSDGWTNHESYIQEIKSAVVADYRVTVSVEKL